MVKRVDIGDDAVEQFALAKTRQPGRGEGKQFTECRNTQMFQYAKRRIMADQPFKIAPGRTNNRCATHTGGGQHIVKTVDARDANHGARREEPAGERQQANAGQQSDNGEDNAEHQHPLVALIQCEIRQ